MADEPLTLIRNKLKALCTCGEDGWSYAIFWHFHPWNPLLLTVEDAYYEVQLGEEIANMLPQAHLLGEGIVGEAAFTGKHLWVHSDGQTQEWNLTGQNICEEDSGWRQQFSYGIKTIAVIPVKASGVVLFGSKKKILERVEFLEQTQRLLMEMDDVEMVDMSGNAVLPLDCESYDLNGLLASISSENSYDSNLKYAHGDNSEDLLRKVYSSASPNDPFPSLYDIYQEGMTSFHGDSCVGDQLKATKEAQIVLPGRDITDVLLKPNSSMNSLIDKNTGFCAWNGEVSCFDSLGQQLVSADVCSADENAFSCSELTVQDSALYSMNIGACQDKLQTSQDYQRSSQSGVVTQGNFPACSNTLHGLSKNIEAVDMSEDFLKFSSMDDICQWFAPSPEDSIFRTITALDNTPSESVEFNPTSFGQVGSFSLVTCPSELNSTTAAVNSDGKDTSSVMHSSESILLDFSCDQADEWWDNMLTTTLSPATATGFSDCISELNIGTLTGTQNGLFSLPLSGEANYNPLNSSDIEYELSTNKRKVVEFSPVNINPIQFATLARPAEARADLMQPISDLDKINNLVSKKDTFPKLQVGGKWIGDGHSINIGRAVPVHPQTQKPKEPTKPTKKSARPKESTQPRPKDRQQIQDCIKELRGIIPNGEKYSIDSLLDQTIRYMFFLQSVTKYADKLREPNEPKLIDQANEVVLEDSNVGDSKNFGVTWALEVGGQTMICPIIVEDMNPPGQMLIEMLCEEQGFFLEIADIIRDFGLNILKAKMELRKNKLWALFIVEANRHVTRIDVFWYLLQQTQTSRMDSANNIANVIDATNS